MSENIPSSDSNPYPKWSPPAIEAKLSVDPNSGQAITVSELESIQTQAYQEGLRLGYKEGLREVGIQAEHLNSILSSLADPVADLDEIFIEQLLALVKAICGRLVRRAVKLDPGQIIPIIREAVSTLPGSVREIRIHLHPEDAILVREALAVSEENNLWKLVEDPVVSRGDCRVDSNYSRVDATLDARLNALMVQLLGGERHGE